MLEGRVALDSEHVASSTGTCLAWRQGSGGFGEGQIAHEDPRFQEESGLGVASHFSMEPF